MSWFRKLRRKFGKKKGYRFPNGIPRVEVLYHDPSQTILDVLESNEDH